jgi:uncharacterized coiled-coil protein SlyX
VLSEKRCERRGTELAQMAKIMELEAVMKSQADKIIELEVTCVNLRCGKDKLTDGYRRLVEKHKLLEQDMAKLPEVNAAEVTKLRDDLDLEMLSYTECHQNVWCRLHEIQEMVASSFDEVKAQCMPFLDKGVKVDEMFNWVVGEVRVVSDTTW